MESMKDLVIQALETKGVLGQIRARLRSAVFKIVDEQDQQAKFGCGLKWENPLLYKILDTKIGQLNSEIIREFMEFFRMDYSLSIFIPECGISPERLKKEEILGKMGVKDDNMEFFQKLQLPLLYYIIFYFLEDLKKNPNKVMESLKKVKDDVEKQSDEIIKTNIQEYGEEHPNYNPEDIPLSDQSPRVNENNEEGGERMSASQVGSNADGQIRESVKSDSVSKKDSIIDIDPGKMEKSEGKEDKNDGDLVSVDAIEEIEEKIVPEEEYEKSGDKKNSSSNMSNTVSQSGGNDISVDSHKLEGYNYVEKAENPNKDGK